MTKDYSKKYRDFENMDRFIDRSRKIDKSSKIPGTAKFKNFFRALSNYLFGDHNWYSYKKAKNVVRFYLTDSKNQTLSPKASKNIQSIFEKISTRKQGRFVEALRPEFIKRFRKPSSEKPNIPNQIALKPNKNQKELKAIKPKTTPSAPTSTNAPAKNTKLNKEPKPIDQPADPQISAKTTPLSAPTSANDSAKNAKLNKESKPTDQFVDPHDLQEPIKDIRQASIPFEPKIKTVKEPIELDREPFILPPPRAKVIQPEAPVLHPDPKDLAALLGVIDDAHLPKVSPGLLFHFHADKFGKNSSLEGMDPTDVLGYLVAYLEERQKNGGKIAEKEDLLIGQLKKAHEIASSKSSPIILTNKIQEAFETKTSLLIPGGWVGLPSGHAIYYELIPENDKKASLRLYNTGEGIQEHAKAKIGVKEKVHYTEWKKIKKENLLDPQFLQSLNELADLDQHGQNIPAYNYRSVYHALKEQLKVKPKNCVHEEISLDTFLMQPQQAGTCAFTSLMAYVKTQMSPNEFRRFKCDLRIQSLTTFSELSTDKTDQKNWRLVKKSFKQLSRKINRLHTKMAISDHYRLSAKNALLPVKEWLNTHKTAAFSTIPPLTDVPFAPIQTTLKIPHADGPSKGGKIKFDVKPALYTHLLSKIAHIKFEGVDDLRKPLSEALIHIKEAQKNSEFQAVHFAIIDLVAKIDLAMIKKSDADWTAKETLIEQFDELGKLFFEACQRKNRSSIVFTDALSTMHKLLSFQCALAGTCKNDEANVFKLEFTPFYFQCHHEKQLASAQIMEKKAENFFQLKIDFPPGYGSAFKYIASQTDNERYNPKQIEELIAKHNPEELKSILENVQKEHPEYWSKKEDWRYMALFSSDSLPAWLKSIRETYIRLHWLSKWQMGQITEGTRDQFTYKLGSSGGTVKINNPLYAVDGMYSYVYQDRLTQRAMQNPLLAKKISNCDYDWEGEKSFIYPGTDSLHSKELLHIFSDPKVSIIETLEFFTKYPDKVRDPDYQLFFQAACFNIFSLKHLTQYTGALATSFISKQLDIALNQNDVATAIFFIRMNRYFSHFSVTKEKTVDGQTILEGLLKRGNLQLEEKSYLYTELAAHIAEKANPTADELNIFLVAIAWKERNPLPKKWEDPKTGYEIEKGLQIHSKSIIEHLLPNGELNLAGLKTIYRQITGQNIEVDWTIKSSQNEELLIESSRQEFFFPLRGRLFAINEEILIPIEIREEFHFQKLFPDIKKGIAIAKDQYEFYDTDGCKVIIVKNIKSLDIIKEINGKSYRYLNNSLMLKPHDDDLAAKMLEALTKKSSKPVDEPAIKSLLKSRKLVEHYTHWMAIEKPPHLLLLDNENKNVSFQITVSANDRSSNKTQLALDISTIARPDGAVLSNADSQFSDFEDPDYIHEWYQNGKLIEVELPRFSLSLKPDPEDESRFLISKYPGFYLSKDQAVPALGSSKTHLLLENAKGHQKLLLPAFKQKETAQKEVLSPKLTYDRKLERDKSKGLKIYEYTITPKGGIEAKSKNANLYLIQTLVANQKYKAAAKLLRLHGEKPTSYTKEEIDILEQIADMPRLTGDESGEMTALSLFSAALLSNNPASQKIGAQYLKDLYQQYLKKYHHVTSLKLTKEEELWVLKTLLSKSYNPHFFARLAELDPDYASHFPYNKTLFDLSGFDTLNPITELREMNFSEYSFRLPRHKKPFQFPLTNSQDEIKNHFFYYIQLALNGKEEAIKQLRIASLFLKSCTSQVDASLGLLLERVLNDPEKYREPLQNCMRVFNPNKPEETAFKESWMRTIERIFEGYSPSPSTAVPASNLTPAYFRLDKQVPIPLELEFNPNFSNTPSLSKKEGLKNLFQQLPKLSNLSDEEYLEIEAWLNEKEKSFSNEDSSLQRLELKKFKQDLLFYKNQPVKKSFTLGVDVRDIKNTLLKEKEAEQTSISHLEAEILRLANRFPQEDIEKTLHLWGGVDKKVSLNNVLHSFAQKRPLPLQKMNGHLTQKDLDQLYSLAGEYLELSVQQQQRERCLSTCKKIEKAAAEDEKEELKKMLAEQVLAKRCYDPKEHPTYLLFEHYSGLILRKEQVKKLSDFLNGGSVNPIHEMIMGSGKSKVLLPLLGLLRANKKDLSLMIVTSPLYESVTHDTHKILGEAFSKSLRTLQFDRNSTFTYRSLEEIRDLLKSAIDNQECLIMTGKSISALILKFIEHTDEMYKEGRIEDETTPLMQEILKLLSSQSIPLVDEADAVLNILHEVSFSLGQKTPPKPYESAVVASLFGLLYTDTDLKQLCNLESDPNPNEKAPPLTKPVYHDAIKPLLAKKMVEKLGELDFHDDQKNQAVHRFSKQLTAGDKQLLIDYLTVNKDNTKNAQNFYNAQSPDVQEILALISKQVSHFLPHTLIKIAGVNYDLHNDLFAIPFSGPDNPNIGSVFSNPYITMNYTFQLYQKKGINKEVLGTLLEQFYREAHLEMQEKGNNLSETKAWKQFAFIKGPIDIPLINYSEGQFEQLINYINASSERKAHIIVSHIFPTIEEYSEKLSCSKMLLAAFFDRLTGFTGTLKSQGSIHRKLTPLPEMGTEAKTFVLLWRMKNAPVEKIKKGSLTGMLGSIKEQQIPFDMLLDSGSYFKEGSNAKVAEELERQFRKPTVYYNKQNAQTVKNGALEEPLSSSKLQADERLTFLDQSHTVGADVPQKIKARALVTIARDMDVRSLFQTVWRARGLGKGQTITYLIDDEVEEIIRLKLGLDQAQQIGFLQIFDFAFQNQCEKNADDSFKAFKQELSSIPQLLMLRNLMRNDLSAVNRKALHTRLRRQLIKQQCLNAAENYGKAILPRPKNIVLNEEKRKIEEELKEFGEELFFLKDQIDDFLTELDPIVNRYLSLVREEVISPITEDSETVEVETSTETETETEAEIEMETLIETEEKILSLKHFNNLHCYYPESIQEYASKYAQEILGVEYFTTKHDVTDKKREELIQKWINGEELPKPIIEKKSSRFSKQLSEPEPTAPIQVNLSEFLHEKNLIFTLSSQMQREPRLQEYSALFEDIEAVTNVLAMDKYGKVSPKLLGNYRTPVHHLRVDGDRVIFLSVYEARLSNYNLTLGFTKKPQELSPIAFQKIVKLKFFNGECQYTKKELEVLKTWMQEVGAEKLRKFFLEIVLKEMPDKLAVFSSTPLGQLFASQLQV